MSYDWNLLKRQMSRKSLRYPLAVLLAGLWARPSWAIEPVESRRGAAYFSGFGCVQCHRIGRTGGTYGPDLTYIGFRKTPQWLDLWLKNPHAWKNNTVMPNFNLNDKARAALVAYLGSLKGSAYRDAPPWDDSSFGSDPVKRGQEIFTRVGCVGCHGRGGKGGYPNNNVAGGKIPALLLVADGYSKEELESRIRNGSNPAKDDPNGPEPMIVMPAWGETLKDDEIDALADYLISIKPKDSGSEGW